MQDRLLGLAGAEARALFAAAEEAKTAAAHLAAAHPPWWVAPAVLGGRS